MNAPASVTITPIRVADLLADGDRMPVYVHVIDHPTRACWSTPA
jgi:N-acyl homoserine lactone hydrolase